MAEGQNKEFLTTNGHQLTRMGRAFNAETRRGRRNAKWAGGRDTNFTKGHEFGKTWAVTAWRLANGFMGTARNYGLTSSCVENCSVTAPGAREITVSLDWPDWQTNELKVMP